MSFQNAHKKLFTQNDVNIKQKKLVFNGFFKIDEYTLTHPLYQGGTSQVIKREILKRGDAVVLIPYDPVNDAVVFVEQFRAGALHRDQSPWLIEFIAGMFNENESPVEVAVREALEEANLSISASAVKPVMSYFSSPGGTTEKIYIYTVAVDSTQAQGVYGLEHEGEDILVKVMTRKEAMEKVSNGQINNAATIIGLQWLTLNYQTFQWTE